MMLSTKAAEAAKLDSLYALQHPPAIGLLLEREEGFAPMPTADTKGQQQIGFGCDLPLTKSEARALMHYRLVAIRTELAEHLPWFETQPPKARMALMLMAYQMGVEGLLKFHTMLHHVKKGDWDAAHQAALNSEWARETPARARRVASLFLACKGCTNN